MNSMDEDMEEIGEKFLSFSFSCSFFFFFSFLNWFSFCRLN